MNEELDLVTSPLSGVVFRDDTRVWLEIFRLGDQMDWALEVINEAGTSIAWGNRFASADAAHAAFAAALEEKGIDAFQDEPQAVSSLQRQMAG